MNKFKELLKRLVKKQLFIPIVALLVLVIFNLIVEPSFFKVIVRINNDGNPTLAGNIIDVIDYGSELAILAIGMTFVTAATGGQDISVGAAICITGSTIVRLIRPGDANDIASFAMPLIFAFLIACVVGMICGAFNGALVAHFKIQPMVATLILYTAGRSIGGWINNNANINISEPTFGYFGKNIPGIPIPTPVFITIACMILVFLLSKFTNINLYMQSVGINEKSSRLNGINPKLIKFLSFVILGVCVTVTSLIKVSRVSHITYNEIAKDIEMDAILAVALGANNLGGGKFSMASSIVGAYVIQFLSTTLLAFNVKTEALPAYKAVVVILLVVMSAPVVREKASAVVKKLSGSLSKKEVA